MIRASSKGEDFSFVLHSSETTMGEILILKSIHGRLLTEKLIDSWFDANEMYVTKKILSQDRYSVEITFIDEERAEMMSDFLKTCYGDSISVARPQTPMPLLDNSFDEERVPSPVHLSSASSVSSRVSCFSQRLLALDKKQNDDKIKLAVGRGRAIDTKSSQMEKLIPQAIDDDDSVTTGSTTPPSIIHSTTSSAFGRGRGAVFK